MSWKCRLIEKEDIPNAEFGDMWFAPWLEVIKKSPEYESEHRGKRPPLVVFVPPGVPFCIDNKADNRRSAQYHSTSFYRDSERQR